MTAEAPPASTAPDGDDLRYYTPEELVDPEGDFRFPTTAGELLKKAYARKIPASKVGGRIRFTRAQIRAIQALNEVAPHGRSKRASRKTPAA